MSAWVELIAREESSRDHQLLSMMRSAHHAQARSLKEMFKRLKEQGE